jgi:hypothetical protein
MTIRVVNHFGTYLLDHPAIIETAKGFYLRGPYKEEGALWAVGVGDFSIEDSEAVERVADK